MTRRFYFLSFILILAGVYSALGQSGRPVPSPSATPAPDSQNVSPDNLQGVPQVAPGYQSVDRSMPELGRVSIIDSSTFDAGTAYAAVNSLQDAGDPQLFAVVVTDVGLAGI